MENKKKMSRLAKAMWITAVVAAVSLIATVCFAVSVGSSALKGALSGQQGFEWMNLIDERALNKLAEIEDYKNLIASQEYAIPVIGNSVIIKSGIAEINIIASDTDEIKAKFEQYSNNNANSPQFTLSIDGQTFTIDCDSERYLNTNVMPHLTIAVPKDAINNIIIENEAGDIDVRGVSVFNLRITNNAGEVDIENTMVNDAYIMNKAGDIELSDSFRCMRKLEASSAFGEIDFNLPQDVNFKLQYSVSAGNVDLSEVDMTKYDSSSQTEVVNSNGIIETKGQTGEKANYSIKVNAGQIKLSSQTDF